MSQHAYRCLHRGRPTLVTMGFDRPLGYVFMTIVTDDEAETILYSNLNDDRAGLNCRDVNFYRLVLQQLDLSVPECMFAETMRDQANRTGSRFVEHRANACECNEVRETE